MDKKFQYAIEEYIEKYLTIHSNRVIDPALIGNPQRGIKAA